MNITSWLTVVSVCLLGAMSPGPSLAVVLRQTLNGGRKAGLVTAIAHGLGFGMYALACVSGIAVVITTSPVLFTGLQWLGAAFLLWLGIKGLLSRPSKTPVPTGGAMGDAMGADIGVSDDIKAAGTSKPDSADTLTIAPRAGSAFRDGFLVVFLNPKIAVFLIAVFSQVIGDHTTAMERLIYVATAMIIDMGWYVIVVWLFSNPLWLGSLQKYAVWFEKIFAVILIALAARLLVGI